MPKEMAASVRQRLQDLARIRQEDFDYVLRQYVMQRLLYRLSRSEYADQFLLKGALLFWVWNKDFHRPTRDIDLLSFSNNDVSHLLAVFQQIIAIKEDDGLVFDSDNMKGIKIREDADYSGVRLTGFANLAKARISFQIDIAFGDVVVPVKVKTELPVFLDLPSPQLRIYPVYSVIAEKFQAMVMLGIANSRMKDIYDISVIAHTMNLDGALLSQAVKSTFERRKTAILPEPLYVFSHDFIHDKSKQTQWKAFLNKSNILNKAGFSETISELQCLLEHVYQSIAKQQPFQRRWLADEFQWEG